MCKKTFGKRNKSEKKLNKVNFFFDFYLNFGEFMASEQYQKRLKMDTMDK